MVEGEGLLLCEITFFFVAPGEKDHNLVEREKSHTNTHRFRTVESGERTKNEHDLD